MMGFRLLFSAEREVIDRTWRDAQSERTAPVATVLTTEFCCGGGFVTRLLMNLPCVVPLCEFATHMSLMCAIVSSTVDCRQNQPQHSIWFLP
jgi:hypothetical protein